LNLADQIRKPLDLRPEIKRYISHCYLDIVDDCKVRSHIARTGYHKELGERSPYNAVNNVKRDVVTRHCNNAEELITEDTNKGPLQKLTVRLSPVTKEASEITVFQDGLLGVGRTRNRNAGRSMSGSA
jgi:hypothetical protein